MYEVSSNVGMYLVNVLTGYYVFTKVFTIIWNFLKEKSFLVFSFFQMLSFITLYRAGSEALAIKILHMSLSSDLHG